MSVLASTSNEGLCRFRRRQSLKRVARLGATFSQAEQLETSTNKSDDAKGTTMAKEAGLNMPPPQP